MKRHPKCKVESPGRDPIFTDSIDQAVLWACETEGGTISEWVPDLRGSGEWRPPWKPHKTYRVTLRHDRGQRTIRTAAKDQPSAIAIVLACEGAPASAVIRVAFTPGVLKI